MKHANNDNVGIAARCGWQSSQREEDKNSDSESKPAKGNDGEKRPEADAEYVEQRLRELMAFERRYGRKRDHI